MLLLLDGERDFQRQRSDRTDEKLADALVLESLSHEANNASVKGLQTRTPGFVEEARKHRAEKRGGLLASVIA